MEVVSLRDIAVVIGVKHTALYYYIPGGKEQLYMEVMTRTLQRHRVGVELAIAEAGPDIRRQMQAVARWLPSQPPLNLAREVQMLRPLSGKLARLLPLFTRPLTTRSPDRRRLLFSAASSEGDSPRDGLRQMLNLILSTAQFGAATLIFSSSFGDGLFYNQASRNPLIVPADYTLSPTPQGLSGPSWGSLSRMEARKKS